MKVLWLTSWYPNKISLLEGDFIQRHARAVSTFTSLSVIYVAQYGETIPIEQNENELLLNEGVEEMKIYFKFARSGIKLLDKLIYNWKYHKIYRSLIESHFEKNGLPDIIHVHVPMKAGVIAKWINRKWGVPYIVSEHSGTYVPGPADTFRKRSFYFKTQVRSIFRDAAAVTSVSLHDGSIIKNLFSLDHVYIIHNVVNTNYFFPKCPFMEKIRFIHVSVMDSNKNTIGILNACSILKNLRQNWELELIGSLDSSIQQNIDKLGLNDFITLKGEISNAEVAQHMQHASALIMFSRHENFPCTIIEALCCGLPVVATNVGGIPEAVNDSNGILVKSEDEEQLLNALVYMIDNYNLYDRKTISENAIQKYNYDVIGQQFYSLYNRVLTDTIQPLS